MFNWIRKSKTKRMTVYEIIGEALKGVFNRSIGSWGAFEIVDCSSPAGRPSIHSHPINKKRKKVHGKAVLSKQGI